MKLHEGKAVIVTGGANGIGEATALKFAEQGASIVIVDVIDSSKLVKTIKNTGGKAVGVQGSVASPEILQEMVDVAVETFGRIDVLVNNAGLPLPPGPIESISVEDWDHVFAVNVRAGFLGTKFALPYLRKTRGSVLFTSSVAGLSGSSNMTSYNSTKAAINNMARSLALDHAPEGVRVNVVCPGVTNTELVKNGPIPASVFEGTNPLGRIVEPREVAEAFVYLASDVACSITGQVLPIDGGYSAGDFTLIPSAFAKKSGN